MLTFNTPISRSHQIHHEINHYPKEREVAAADSIYCGNANFWRTLQPLAQKRNAWSQLEVLHSTAQKFC